jgi:tetratricopeptide (TPR) repeat protein/DNA-binding XRE family transcriptional regulator
MSGENENEFSILLTNLRKTRSKQRKWGMDWTQEGVAKRLGVSRATYNYWENGKADPSRDDLKNIVSDFGLDDKEAAALFLAAEQAPPIRDTLPIQSNPDIPGPEEHTDALYTASEQEPPKIRHLPPRNPFFTGRETYLKQLRDFLQKNGTVALTQPVSISGLGGIGKTQLALAYAYDCYPNVYSTVLWVNAADPTTLQAGYDSIAERLELPELNGLKPYQRVQAVKQWLEEHTNWLLILDNADDLQLARSFFPECDHRRILLTTRSQYAGKIGARRLEIDKMEQEEGLIFLLRRSGVLAVDANPDTVAVDIREPAHQLVELLDGHPLSLDQAGAYIEETGESFPEYINLYQNQRRLFLGKYGALEGEPSEQPEYSQHPETVVVTFELCFEKAHERHPLATDILRFCAFLQPDAIPAELFQHDDNFKIDRDTFNSGIAALQRYSLIKRNAEEQTFSIHRLVQDVLIDAMSHDLQEKWRERVVRALYLAFPKVELEIKTWRQCERLVSHVLVCATWSETRSEGELTPIVAVATRLFHMAGFYLANCGRDSEAEPLLVQVLATYEQHIEAEHPNTAYALMHLALCYSGQCKYDQAEPLYQRALAIQEKRLGDEHYETTQILCQLAFCYSAHGKDEQAEPLLKRMLSLEEKQLGAEHPNIIETLYGLAMVCQNQGKNKEAELLYQRAFSIWEKHLGLEIKHPNIITPLVTWAILLHRQGRHEQADELFQRFLNFQEQLLWATHPAVRAVKRKYAEFLRSIDRVAEAAALEVDDEPPG